MPKTIDGGRPILTETVRGFCRRWSSFAAGGSVSIYIYCYAIYYFVFKTK